MKKMILVFAMLLALAACAEAWTTAQNPPEIGSAMAAAAEYARPKEQDVKPIASPANLDAGNGKAVSTPVMPDKDEADADAVTSAAIQDQTTEGLPEEQGTSAAEGPAAEQGPTTEPENTPAPEATFQPEFQSTAAPAPAAYGAIPFELAVSTGTWWKIDATDSAYWAVQENINAMR
ncbi:MAG: hypothetical protein NC311_12220, partial [Muribaculaceae bacterium]|nr:hypothetical protein [Muribaculaceae bacterium]